jgi:Winged helix DNA-binding domain
MSPSNPRSSHTAAEAIVTWPHVLAWRVRRQGLAERAPADEALAVVARIGGLHAQLLSSAELTLHARVDDLDLDAVTRALWTDRTLVKTWAMRGTLHLLPAEELPAFVGAMRAIPPRHHQGAWLKHHGLTRALADAILAAIPDGLADAEAHPRRARDCRRAPHRSAGARAEASPAGSG